MTILSACGSDDDSFLFKSRDENTLCSFNGPVTAGATEFVPSSVECSKSTALWSAKQSANQCKVTFTTFTANKVAGSVTCARVRGGTALAAPHNKAEPFSAQLLFDPHRAYDIAQAVRESLSRRCHIHVRGVL